jgi:hypothetical protein
VGVNMRFLQLSQRGLINIDRIDLITIDKIAYEDDKYTIRLVQNRHIHTIEGGEINNNSAQRFIKNLMNVKDNTIVPAFDLLYDEV